MLLLDLEDLVQVLCVDVAHVVSMHLVWLLMMRHLRLGFDRLLAVGIKTLASLFREGAELVVTDGSVLTRTHVVEAPQCLSIRDLNL